MKVALYKDCAYDWAPPTILEVIDYRENGESSYIRVSHIIEIDFILLPDTDTLQRIINHLDYKYNKVQLQAVKELEEIQQKKQELLALTFEVKS